MIYREYANLFKINTRIKLSLSDLNLFKTEIQANRIM